MRPAENWISPVGLAKFPGTMTDSASLSLWVAGGMLLLALLLLAFWAYRRRGRRRARLAPPLPSLPTGVEQAGTRYPIVLAHGFLGFDVLALPGLRHEYFRGVREALESQGHRVYVVRVSPVASIRRRAEQLVAQLDALQEERVNIVAHSMGGLDARYAISHLGAAARVASLVTVGTPHRGTPLADRGFPLGTLALVRRMMVKVGADIDGLYDITTARMARFNERVPDVAGVFYASYVGVAQHSRQHLGVHRLLLPSFTYLERRVGGNDGLIPAVSQRWGEVIEEIPVDHWGQIGWSYANGFDVRAFYADIARMLRERGF